MRQFAAVHAPCRPAQPGVVRGLLLVLMLAAGVTLPAADDAPPAAEPSAAAKALIEHIRQLRPNLADEDKPTRDAAVQALQTDANAVLKAIFRVPADEDGADERKLLTLVANQLQMRLLYEQNLLKLPVERRAAVDAMLEKIPGMLNFYGAEPPVRIKLLEALAATKPDPDTLAPFLCLVMHDPDPLLVQSACTQARTAPVPLYFNTCRELLTAGYIARYFPKNLDDDQLEERLQQENVLQAIAQWYDGLLQLTGAIPGESADKLLTEQLLHLTDAEDNGLVRHQVGNNTMLVNLANLLVKRNVQSAFPALVLQAQARELDENTTDPEDGTVGIDSSTSDLLIYAAFRLIDKTVPERPTGTATWLHWQDNADRLKFYDNFLDAFRADVAAKKPNRDGLNEYADWYDQNHESLINAARAVPEPVVEENNIEEVPGPQPVPEPTPEPAPEPAPQPAPEAEPAPAPVPAPMVIEP